MVELGAGRSLVARAKRRARLLRSPQSKDDAAPGLAKRVGTLSREVQSLRKRVVALEAEVLEANSQGRRIGEISDLVTELLVSEASRRDPDFQRIVDKYANE